MLLWTIWRQTPPSPPALSCRRRLCCWCAAAPSHYLLRSLQYPIDLCAVYKEIFDVHKKLIHFIRLRSFWLQLGESFHTNTPQKNWIQDFPQCQLLEITNYHKAHFHALWHAFAHFCTLLHTFAHFCIFLHTFAYFCILLHTFPYCCILWQAFAYIPIPL